MILTLNFEVYCDLPGRMTGISTVPTDIVITNQRPDIVIVNRDSNDITLIELTIPFYTNIENAHERKKDRYDQLVSEINNTNYDSKLYTIEIGSNGLINKDNCDKLFEIAKASVTWTFDTVSNRKFKFDTIANTLFLSCKCVVNI